MGTVIAVATNKGGVGKTTTALNLADALGRLDQRVCFFDADNQCNSTATLLPPGSVIRKSLYDVLDPAQEITSLEGFFYPSTCKNVMLVPNVDDTALLERDIIITSQKKPEVFFRLRSFVRDLVLPTFDFVIIDLPPNIGTFSLSALLATHCVIVPIRAGSTNSLVGLTRMMDLIRQIQNKPLEEGGNPELRFLRLLINAADRRTTISRTIINEVRTTFAKDEVFNTEIPINSCFEIAESRGQTVFQTDSSSLGSRAFRELGKELMTALKGDLA